MKSKIAVYPGTFDPPTNGHIDIAKRAVLIFDKLIIGVVENNPSKNLLFSLEERIIMLNEIFKDFNNIEIKSFDGLLVNFVESQNAIAIVRGLRAVSDFEYELQLASLNSMLNKNIETVFFMASDENLFVSSSIIKEIARLKGDVSNKVPDLVWKILKNKFNY